MGSHGDSRGYSIPYCVFEPCRHLTGSHQQLFPVIILITDGSPTEGTAEEIVATAQTIFARIDTYYCGSQSDERATGLCRQLAQYGGECIIDPSGANMLHDLTLLLC